MASVSGIVSGKQAVVFDLFHTLTAIESSWGDGLPFTCDMLGVSREDWNAQLNRHSMARLTGEQDDPFTIVSEMARAIDPTITDETIAAAVANRVRRFAASIVDIPAETQEVLRTLKSQGKKLGLISNADVMEVAAWDKSPIAGLFDATVLSCHVGAAKPQREIYEVCLNRLGVTADEAVFVGDGGSSELRGAKAVGMTAVMIVGVIRELWPEKIEQRKPDADFVIEHLSELLSDREQTAGAEAKVTSNRQRIE